MTTRLRWIASLLLGLLLIAAVPQAASADDLPPNMAPISDPEPGVLYIVDMHAACQVTYPDETPFEIWPSNPLSDGPFAQPGWWTCLHMPLSMEIINSQSLGPVDVQAYCDAWLGRGSQAQPSGDGAEWACKVPMPQFDSVTGLA